MKIIQSVLLYVTLLFCFSACQKEVAVKLPPVETKLVVRCFISPQNKQIQVAVSQTQPVFNNPNYKSSGVEVKDATVTISSENGFWSLGYVNSIEGYVIDTVILKIKEGVTYKLSVRTPDGKYVESHTTIPSLHTTLYAFTTVDSTSVTLPNIRLKANWQDPLNSKDYYQLAIEKSGQHTSRYFIQNVVYDDAVNSGGIINSNRRFYYDNNSNDTIFVSLATISREYYDYFVRLYNFESSNEPFSEPYPMYTNITGGYGIFAGFNKMEVQVLPK